VMALLSKGHAYSKAFRGWPRTLLISTLARNPASLGFSASQPFTGRTIQAEPAPTSFRMIPTPAAANSFPAKVRSSPNHDPADEIKPHAAKTQAALASKRSGAPRDRRGHRLIPCPSRFFVLATQNPIGARGNVSVAGGPTRPFQCFTSRLVYPSRDEELAVMKQDDCFRPARVADVVDGREDSPHAQELVRNVVVADHGIPLAPPILCGRRGRVARRAEVHRRLGFVGRRSRASQYLILGRQGAGRLATAGCT